MIRTFWQAVFVLALALLYGGCSSKEYYKPEKTVNNWPVCKEPRFSAESIVGETPSKRDIPIWPVCERAGVHLAYTGAEGAVAEKGWLLDKQGITGLKIPESQRFLGESDGWVLYTGIDGNVTLQNRDDANRTIVMPLEKTVAAASVRGDLMAVLFASNDMGIYRLSTQKSYFKTQGRPRSHRIFASRIRIFWAISSSFRPSTESSRSSIPTAKRFCVRRSSVPSRISTTSSISTSSGTPWWRRRSTGCSA